MKTCKWKLTSVFKDEKHIVYFEASEENIDQIEMDILRSTVADDIYIEKVIDSRITK